MSDTQDSGDAVPPARSNEEAAPEETAREKPGRAPPAEETAAQAAAPGEDDATARIAELEDKWRRALADLDNHRKRTARALEWQCAEERARTSAAWLPVLDDLERALEHADAEPDAVIQGVRSVLDRAREVIGHLGFPRRDDEGRPFDPVRHEAVSTIADSDAPDGTVVRVLRPGYGGDNTQLRPAQVVVAKGRGDGATS